jgi:hypothetical protein
LFSNPNLLFALLAGSAVVCVALAWWLWKRRPGPQELERRRRMSIHGRNRVIEGFVTEASATEIQYCYDLRGVEYFASQDVRSLAGLLGEHPERLIGPVSVKFEPANPANSIVLCEEWSGWRTRQKNQGEKTCESASI